MKQNYDDLAVELADGENGRPEIRITNNNSFRVGDITVTAEYSGKKMNQVIGRIEAHKTWRSGERTEEILPFHPAAFYSGKEQVVDADLYNAETGIYHGEPCHALVWKEKPEESERRIAAWKFEDPKMTVTLSYLVQGPRVAFIGHSFTGLWDSAYEYFRQMAEADGYHAQVAYSYWGGTGLAQYAGLIPESMARADQCRKVMDANAEYDFCVFAGNSDEALATCSGKIGAEDYSLRENMERAVEILKQRTEEKHAKMILWVPHAYRYGFFRDKTAKPWRPGKVGERYERDGWQYQLTLSEPEMVEKNMEWYRYLCEKTGRGEILLAPVAQAYHEILTSGIGDPYLSEESGGDFAHQNNLGNYIAACVCFETVFGKKPKADLVPVSHTWGMGGGKFTGEQAAFIREKVHEVMVQEQKKQ